MKEFAALIASLIFAAACNTTLAPISDASTPSTSANHKTEWRIPATESFIIHSSVAQRDFEVTVATPRGYSESSGEYPVL